MLASVYSYRVMVKSVSSCCVRGRWVLSDPVTYKRKLLILLFRVFNVSRQIIAIVYALERATAMPESLVGDHVVLLITKAILITGLTIKLAV